MSSASVKTAISLDGELLREAQGVARRLKVSRSRLFATAMQEYLERRRNRELLKAVNAAHAGGEDAQEARLSRVRRALQRKTLAGEW